MKGLQKIKISNGRIQYKLELRRNITIVKGNSGTGKTTLFEMVAEYTRLGEKSGVQIQSDNRCAALIDMDWENQLKKTSNSIVFIDEGFEDLNSIRFAHAVRESDNYYIIFCRENLHNLPYSVDEIYEMKMSGKFNTLKKLYSPKRHFLYTSTKAKTFFRQVLTEDGKSGFMFFSERFKDTDVTCSSAGSNSAIFQWLNDHPGEAVFVVADGAAFGAEIERVMMIQRRNPDKVAICLPESFEWLILKSGLIKDSGIAQMLESPEDFIESDEYFSWERFFTAFLEELSQGTHYQYTKKEINPFYTIPENSDKIMALISVGNIK